MRRETKLRSTTVVQSDWWHSGESAVLQIGRSLIGFQMVSLEFSLTLSFRSHYGPGVDSASNRNEYQENFLGVNTAGA